MERAKIKINSSVSYLASKTEQLTQLAVFAVRGYFIHS